MSAGRRGSDIFMGAFDGFVLEDIAEFLVLGIMLVLPNIVDEGGVVVGWAA